MSMGLLAWSVLCIGVALVAGAALGGGKNSEYGPVVSSVAGAGVGCFLWGLGLGLWLLVGLMA